MVSYDSKLSLPEARDQYLVAPITQRQHPRRVARILWCLVTAALVASVYVWVQSAPPANKRLDFSLAESLEDEFDWYAVSSLVEGKVCELISVSVATFRGHQLDPLLRQIQMRATESPARLPDT